MNDQSTVLAELNRIAKVVDAAERRYDNNIEQLYGQLLEFIASNSSFKSELLPELLNSVTAYRHARTNDTARFSIDALAYCMHHLRWKEVLEVVVKEHTEYFAPRKEQSLQRLIDAFNDDWSRAEDYARYGR